MLTLLATPLLHAITDIRSIVNVQEAWLLYIRLYPLKNPLQVIQLNVCIKRSCGPCYGEAAWIVAQFLRHTRKPAHP